MTGSGTTGGRGAALALGLIAALALPSFPARANGPDVVATLPPLASLLRMLDGAARAPQAQGSEHGNGQGSEQDGHARGGDAEAGHDGHGHADDGHDHADRGPADEVAISSGGHTHGGALAPSARAAIERADLVLWIGPGLEPSLMGLARGDDRFLALGMAEGVERRLRSGFEDWHVWLDPANARAMLGAIAARLDALDPGNAGLRAEALEEADGALAALEGDLRERLAPLAGRAYVVEHDAFGHFARAMGLEPAIAAVPGGEGDAGARRLRGLIAEVREREARCLIAEPGGGARLGRTLDLPVVEIDPRRGAGAGTYRALLEHVAEGFELCLGG